LHQEPHQVALQEKQEINQRMEQASKEKMAAGSAHPSSVVDPEPRPASPSFAAKAKQGFWASLVKQKPKPIAERMPSTMESRMKQREAELNREKKFSLNQLLAQTGKEEKAEKAEMHRHEKAERRRYNKAERAEQRKHVKAESVVRRNHYSGDGGRLHYTYLPAVGQKLPTIHEPTKFPETLE
jgi:hypothetical protein